MISLKKRAFILIADIYIKVWFFFKFVLVYRANYAVCRLTGHEWGSFHGPLHSQEPGYWMALMRRTCARCGKHDDHTLYKAPVVFPPPDLGLLGESAVNFESINRPKQ